jgi:type VI secretion system secreted protein VgrG
VNSPSDLAGASLIDALFGVKLSQHARLITIASSQDSALPQALVAERFTGREAVNELFGFDVDALSTSTDLDLTSFIGEEVTITLLQPDGSRRAWHGLCTDAAWLGADGGLARYRLHLQPALALLGLRRDSYIFQDKDARDLIGELLADYPQVRHSFDVAQALAVRPIWTQYRESDLEFLQRVLAAEGLSWRFEHDQEGDEPPEGGAAQARHRIVFFDSQAALPATPGGDTLRFHGVRASDTDDAIDRFAAQRRVAANAVSISSWDPAQLMAPAAEQLTSLDIGEMPSLSIYDGSAERRHDNKAFADAHSRVMLQALELDNKQFEGAGAVRRMAAGHGFTLTQHDSYADGGNSFKTLWVEHEARNNLEPALGEALSRLTELAEAGAATLLQFSDEALEPGTYRNRFGCVREAVAIVPRAAAARFAGASLGPQTAIVVGLPETINTTTREHQVRIQFAWQRGVGAISGGLTHDTDEKGNAPGNDASGTWVRVAEALAGPNWGSQFTPRIGTEVLVDFIEGDMDRPLVVAQLYTGSDTPPFSAGVDTGINHAGVISGMHSNNFDGGGFNQWVLDDTSGQLRTRLATSSAGTQLNLGYLVQQAAGSAQRGAYRGTGFELRTDAWAVVRGGEGVLMSATARAQQGSSVTSTQLDSSEAIGLLRGAGELGTTLLNAATAQKALSSKEALQAQVEMIEQVDPKQKGKFAGGVGGQDALKATAGSRDADAEAAVEKFGAPLVLMEAPSSINWATSASTVMFAGGQLQWTTQADLHMAAAYTVASVSANATGLFTHDGGIQAVAANGPVSLQAHTDKLEILADKAVTIVSVNDVIEIKAKEKIVLQSGQSSVTLEGGNITFACPGNFSVKGGQHVLAEAQQLTAKLTNLPGDLTQERRHWIALNYLEPETATGIAGADYEIHFKEGSIVAGTLDSNGKARHDNIDNKPVRKIIYKPRFPEEEQPHDPLASLENS